MSPTTPKMNALKRWMEAATPEQQEDLAEHLETSRNVLYQYSGEFRNMSAGRAREIEEFTLRLHKETKGKLPKVYRTDLNADCRACDFAQKCLGAAAVASDFAFLPADDSEGGAV